MENNQGYQPQASQPYTQPLQTQQRPNKNNSSLIVLLFVFLSLCSLVAAGVFAYENMKMAKEIESLKISQEQMKLAQIPTPIYTPPATPTVTSEPSKDVTPTKKICDSTFTSKYLDLSFKYDSCLWKLTEKLDPAGSSYNTITASNIKTGNIMILRGDNIGMGGGYPGCEKSEEAIVLNNKLVRVKTTNGNYLYLTEKNNPAIKDLNGSFGNLKFNEYFTYLNPEAFPDANICWTSGGTNLVKMVDINNKEPKDLIVTIEDKVIQSSFLKEADAFALIVYSSMPKY